MRKVARFRKPTSNGATEYNNREAKLRFLFGMYDLDVDNRISRSELLSVLQMMVGASVTMEQVGFLFRIHPFVMYSLIIELPELLDQ